MRSWQWRTLVQCLCLAALMGCQRDCPTVEVDAGRRSDELLQQYLAWQESVALEVCIPRIRARDLEDAEHMGKYRPRTRKIDIAEGLKPDYQRLILQHELCHAADLQNGLLEDALHERPSEEDREAFAHTCELGAATLNPLRLHCAESQSREDEVGLQASLDVYLAEPVHPTLDQAWALPIGTNPASLAAYPLHNGHLLIDMRTQEGLPQTLWLDPVSGSEVPPGGLQDAFPESAPASVAKWSTTAGQQWGDVGVYHATLDHRGRSEERLLLFRNDVLTALDCLAPDVWTSVLLDGELYLIWAEGNSLIGAVVAS